MSLTFLILGLTCLVLVALVFSCGDCTNNEKTHTRGINKLRQNHIQENDIWNTYILPCVKYDTTSVHLSLAVFTCRLSVLFRHYPTGSQRRQTREQPEHRPIQNEIQHKQHNKCSKVSTLSHVYALSNTRTSHVYSSHNYTVTCPPTHHSHRPSCKF